MTARLREWWLRLLGTFANRNGEIEEELRLHLEMAEADAIRRGQSVREARVRAGGFAYATEALRDQRGFAWLRDFVIDIRYGSRLLMKRPLFAGAAIVSLGLGIGANSAIYSFMDSIMLRALPAPHAESLVMLNWHSQEPRGVRPNHVMHGSDGETWKESNGVSSGIFPYGAFELLAQNKSIFSSLFVYYTTDKRTVTINGESESVKGEYVSGDYFRGLDVKPAAGRLIFPSDDRAGAPLVVVISMRLSERRFSGAERAVGQTVLVDSRPLTVIGVSGPEFFGVDPETAPDFYVPLHANLVMDGSVSWAKTPKSYLDHNYYWIEMMGRLQPGVNIAQAQRALATPFHQWVEATANNEREKESLPGLTVKAGAAGLDTLRRRYSKPLYVLWGMVGLILAIACFNTANLLLARAAARRREIAVRLSIGAGRLRLIRQLLTESVLLGVMGGFLGLALALWGMRVLTFLLANGQENFTLRAELNWHVLIVTFAVSVLCGALFGLAPALQSTRSDVTPALKGSRTEEPHAGFHLFGMCVSLGQVLVTSQIVFSLLMLIAAGLFVRTLSNLRSIQMGFNRENLLLFEVNARQAGHRDPEITAFYAELRKRLAAIPGVRDVTLSHASLIGAGRRLDIRVSGVPAPDTRILNAGPGFFSTMQVPIVLGREIDERDQPGSSGVVVANERFVKLHFGNENPLGRRVTLGGPHPRDMEIVGVTANAHYGRPKEDTQPVVYIPYNQGDYPRVQQMVYALRTKGDPLAYVKAAREVLREYDSRVPVMNVVTQAAEIDRTMNQEIIFAHLCTGFSILALVISCVGLYGTMAYMVSRRTAEIGIRMALGARRGMIVRMILQRVLALAVVGIAFGLLTALTASSLVESFLFGVQANDFIAIAGAVAVLMASAVAAGYVPAVKAARIDPVAALRSE